MARLTAPNGATVTVSDDKVDGLVSRGFTSSESKPAKKTAAKKASSSKSSK